MGNARQNTAEKIGELEDDKLPSKTKKEKNNGEEKEHRRAVGRPERPDAHAAGGPAGQGTERTVEKRGPNTPPV